MNNKANLMIQYAKELAMQSKCEQRGVAAIITNDDFSQIYSIGINGGPKGLDDCLCDTPGKYGCIHAEINALIKCPVTCEDKTMIITLSPCVTCAAAIINAGIKRVICYEIWKDTTGIDMLASAGISVEIV